MMGLLDLLEQHGFTNSIVSGGSTDFVRPWSYETCNIPTERIQEAQLMLTTGSTRIAVIRGQQTWYHSTC